MDYIKTYKTSVANAKKTLDIPVVLDVVYSQITNPNLKVAFGQLLPLKKLYFWDFGIKAARELEPGMEIAIICGKNRYDCELVTIINDQEGEIGDIFEWARQYGAPWKNVCALKMFNQENILPSKISEYKSKTTEVTKSFLRVTDQILKSQTFKEGRSFDVVLTKYERNSTARRLCVKHNGAVCKICSFDFFKEYGELGKGFIHVHHKIPISKSTKNYKINPITDLVPVCPNCHAMLHSSKDNMLSVEDLKQIYNQYSGKQ
jgi:hypothetical protein